MHEQLVQWWETISLRTKVTGFTVFVVTLGLLVVGVGTLTVLQRTLIDEVDRQLSQAADELPQTPETFNLRDFDAFTDLTPSVFSNPFYFGAIASDGSLIDDNVSDASRSRAPDVAAVAQSDANRGEGGITVTSGDRTAQWRVFAFPLTVSSADTGERSTATLVIGADLTDTNAIIGSFASIFLGFGLIVVIVSAVLTSMLVTSTFRPLRDVEATAARFASGDFSQRLGGTTPNTEVGRLNRSLNIMLSRIDRAFADRASTISQMRRFVGDASHELRTPLVSVRGYAELYRMGALNSADDVAQAMQRIEKEAIRMGELVTDLLALARLDESRPLELAALDLLPVAHDAALDSMASAPDRVVTVVVDIAPVDTPVTAAAAKASASFDLHSAAFGTAPVDGDPSVSGVGGTASGIASSAASSLAGFARARLRGRRAAQPATHDAAPAISPLSPVSPVSNNTGEVLAVVTADENKIRQVVTNLVGNALRFSPAGSPIEITVGVDRAASMGTISVVDHGEGIAPQLREKIFERFFRADSSRARDTGGSGLGLAIVASIVGLHAGHVVVLETPGGGATFRVALPLAIPTHGLPAHGLPTHSLPTRGLPTPILPMPAPAPGSPGPTPASTRTPPPS
jgi:two-component system OmpR family sensor kinase